MGEAGVPQLIEAPTHLLTQMIFKRQLLTLSRPPGSQESKLTLNTKLSEQQQRLTDDM